MKPAEAPPSDSDRLRSDDEKRALIQEYDAADYRGRYAVLDREHVTIRQISRWRNETRGANLRVAGALTAPKPARKPAPASPAEAPTVLEQASVQPAPAEPVVPPEPEPKVAAKPTSAPKKPKAASRTGRKASSSEPARPARNRRTATPAVRSPAATPAARATPSTRPEPTSRRRQAAVDKPVDVPRRQRRRAGAAELAATALRDAALAHSNQIRQHAEALQKMVAGDAWQTVTAAAGPAAPDPEVLLAQIRTAERAADVLRDQLAATVHATPARHSDPAEHRGRKPWWGATSG